VTSGSSSSTARPGRLRTRSSRRRCCGPGKRSSTRRCDASTRLATEAPMLADPRTHNDAFIAALQGAGLVIGDAREPSASCGWQGVPGEPDFAAFVTVDPLPQDFDGSLGCPDVDSTLEWQATCVG